MGISELISYKSVGKFFDNVLELDKGVRFVAVHDGHFKAKYKKGIDGYFEEKEVKASLSEAQSRWDSRKKLRFRIGDPKYAMAQYGKINRLTVPLGDEGVILITTEIDVDIRKIADGVIYARSQFLNSSSPPS